MAKKPLNVDTLWQLQRVGGIAASPDGTQAVCSVSSYSMEHNRSSTQLWLLSTLGGKPRALTHCGDKDGQPAWSPQGNRIAFVARREQEGSSDKSAQLYVIPSDGGEARRVTTFGPGVEAFRWMPDGKRIVFIAWIWPELKGTAAQNKRQQAFAERKESGYATSEGQYRYWDRNLPMGRVPHLLMVDVASGRVTDLLEGSGYELPRDDPGLACFDVSPDGRHIAFACDLAAVKMAGQRLSLVELDLRAKRFSKLADHARWDLLGPRYSPDGAQLAFSATEVGRHHMAMGQLAFATRGKKWSEQAAGWVNDVPAALLWSADGRSVHFAAEERGRCHAWRFDIASGGFDATVRGGWVQALSLGGPADAETLVVAIDSASHPVQVHAHRESGARRLESFNDAVLDGITFGQVQEVGLRGALGDEVQMWLTFPPGVNPAKKIKKKHPLLHVIHGGPYAAAGDTFSYRWNPQVLACKGHVVAQVNFHGSSSFGFEFRSSISGRLGELELQDLEAATEWLVKQPWADASRLHASGGSYGGYLVAWMNGHLPAWPLGRIRSYICHAGVFDRVATWSADSYTQRHKDLGATYWADPARVQAQSPAAFAANMNTPTLVMHGALDYRVPDQNGLAYYNTLKARGVDARLLWFADENHWILKPRNSKQWYGEFFDWLERQDKRKR